MGNDEPVTPVFPNSDYWWVDDLHVLHEHSWSPSLQKLTTPTPFSTGVAGVAGVLTSLIRRAENGGSYSVDVSQNQPSYFQMKRT